MSSYILGITNKMQLFIPFFSVANVFKLFPGDKSFTYRQVVENFCFLGGGSRRVCSGNRGEVSRHQQAIVYKLENTY